MRDTGTVIEIETVSFCDRASGLLSRCRQTQIVVFSAMTILCSLEASAIDVAATAKALRIAGTITGGSMPTSDPMFKQMVGKIQTGDVAGASAIAAASKYAANYLARRLALQMQSPALNAGASKDNDSTAFIIAHLVGGGGMRPSISTLLSENATYLVNVPNGTGVTAIHAADLSPAQLAGVDWSASLVRQNGQMSSGGIAIPAKHVGGFATASDRAGDQSFAMYGATAGTNLRMIEGIWEISTGLALIDVESTNATPQNVPRFVPETNANFFHGQGQAACIACHGGGFSSLNHGYSAVADVFDFDSQNGLTYIASPTTSTMKSLGSDPKNRTSTLACNLAAKPNSVCNPDSSGADPNQGWDLNATWGQSGVLTTMGWTAPTSGQGLNQLGSAIGKTKILYEYLTKRVIREICPLGAFTADDVSAIGAAVNPNAQPAGTDDFRTIVSMVAANSSCQ